MHALLSISLLVCLRGATAFQEVSSPEYIALTAADWFGILELPGIFTESMCPTLRAPGDELPWEEGIISDGTRYKYIHTVGAVGQVQWVDRGGHSYSGLFSGATNGVVRFSLAKEPSPPSLNGPRYGPQV